MDTEAAVGAVALSMAETVGSYIVALLVGGGAGAMLGVLMFGRRYKQRIAALEARPSQGAVQVNVNVGDAKKPTARRTSTGAMLHVAERRPDEDTALVGTVCGPMTIRLGDDDKTLEDVVRILRKNEVLASLSDEYGGGGE